MAEALSIKNILATFANTKEHFSAYDNTGGTSIVAIADVTIDTTFVNSNGSVFTLASNILTINKTAIFSISYDVSSDVTVGTARSDSRSQLEWRVNSGGIFATVDLRYGSKSESNPTLNSLASFDARLSHPCNYCQLYPPI